MSVPVSLPPAHPIQSGKATRLRSWPRPVAATASSSETRLSVRYSRVTRYVRFPLLPGVFSHSIRGVVSCRVVQPIEYHRVATLSQEDPRLVAEHARSLVCIMVSSHGLIS